MHLSFLDPLYTAVAWVLTQLWKLLWPVFGFYNGFTWVLSIVLLTVLMRLIMVPLFIKQMHTTRAMTALSPQISELRKKHKGDRERLNSETMKLYQEAGVNPLMGCLPVLLQMPVFFALFSVLRQLAAPSKVPLYGLTAPILRSAKHATIFGVTIADKFFGSGVKGGPATPLHYHVVIGIAVLVSMTTTYLTVKQSQKRGMMPTGGSDAMGQSQKMMAYIMPVFALFGVIWPFGLVMYWVTTNMWTLGQQFVLLRKFPIATAMADAAGRVAGRPGSGPGKGGAQPPSGRTETPRGAVRPGGAQKPGSSQKPGGAPRPAGQAKPGIAARPGTPGKAGGAAKPGSAATPAAAKPGAAAEGGGSGVQDAVPDGKVASGNTAPATGSPNGKPGSAGARPARDRVPSSDASGNGQGSSPLNSGLLRKFGRGRSEPVPDTEPEPEVRYVRQQRQRQSRSKRSGKR